MQENGINFKSTEVFIQFPFHLNKQTDYIFLFQFKFHKTMNFKNMKFSTVHSIHIDYFISYISPRFFFQFIFLFPLWNVYCSVFS